VAQAEAEASSAQAQPVGTLRVHAVSSLGQNYVVPAVAAYQERYPAVTVDLTLSQNLPDLLEEGYDVALRIAPGALPDSAYVSRRLGTFYSILCASPKYLAIHGVPQSIEDLSNHTCLQVDMPDFPVDRWHLQDVQGNYEFSLPDGRFKVNVPDAMAVAALEGMGIGALPTFTVRSLLRSGTLKRVLPDYQLETLNVFAVYASHQHLDAKIKAWVELLRECTDGALSTE
jgi:DNA-binding transcriptional LysR family regulator